MSFFQPNSSSFVINQRNRFVVLVCLHEQLRVDITFLGQQLGRQPNFLWLPYPSYPSKPTRKFKKEPNFILDVKELMLAFSLSQS